MFKRFAATISINLILLRLNCCQIFITKRIWSALEIAVYIHILYSRQSEPSHICNYEWCDLLSPFPWASELWPPASLQSTWSHSRDSTSSWLGSQHWHQRIPAILSIISARADSTEIGHQEHDVCCTSLSWSLPGSVCHVLWDTWVPMKLKNRCSICRTETHLSLWSGFPNNFKFQCLWYPMQRLETVVNIHWRLNS